MTDVTHDEMDDGFHEIHLSGKQLFALFMATVVVSVVIFLIGVFVGRNVRSQQAAAAEHLSDSAAALTPAPVRQPAPAPAVAPQHSVVATGNPPLDWDITTGRNIVWSVELGNETFGRPVVAGDAIYIGTDNARHLDPAFEADAGVLMADFVPEHADDFNAKSQDATIRK